MSAVRASVVIPAHDEAAVIERTLRALAPAAADGSLRVVVACNGCTDDTAERARRFPGVVVAEVGEASKTAALRAGDALADGFPRFYLDADIEIPLASVHAVADALLAGYPAGRPPLRYDLSDVTWAVRRFHAARVRIPSVMQNLWGAGVYALSAQGRARFGDFPDVTADDMFVDALFARDEIAIPECEPVVVRVARTGRALVTVLSRAYAADRLRGTDVGPTTSTATTLRQLAASVTGPSRLLDAAVYAGVVVAARVVDRYRRRSGRSGGWSRDTTSRTVRA